MNAPDMSASSLFQLAALVLIVLIFALVAAVVLILRWWDARYAKVMDGPVENRTQGLDFVNSPKSAEPRFAGLADFDDAPELAGQNILDAIQMVRIDDVSRTGFINGELAPGKTAQ